MEQFNKYPDTRYMGSKQRIASHISDVFDLLSPSSALDAFSGSGVVGYLLKTKGVTTHTNDFLKFAQVNAKALIENNATTLSSRDVEIILADHGTHGSFVSQTFKGIYYTDEDNYQIDLIRHNIEDHLAGHKKVLALAALNRACIKKRGRGVFTYTGLRYDDGRNDLKLSMSEQFRRSVAVLNSAVFSNRRRNQAFNVDIFDFPYTDYDLVYIDPPYYSPHSDNDYSRRYHFVEGLTTLWSHVNINEKTKTKKFNNIKSPFDSRTQVYDAFDRLFHKFRKSDLVVSYSSNNLPTAEEMVSMLRKYKDTVEVIEIDHKYSFGTQKKGLERNTIKEFLFIAT
jgi:DNA adenine methylase